MKFLKRKSQREDFPEYVEVQPPVTVEEPSVAKDLPPTPLYARFARMSSSPSFESLTTGLDSPSASRFSGYNGSTPSLASHSTDGAPNTASQGRAAGASLLNPGYSASNSNLAPAAKPEPIKLKPRRGRTTNDDTPRVIPTGAESTKAPSSSIISKELSTGSVDRSGSNPDTHSGPPTRSLENRIFPSTANATVPPSFAGDQTPPYKRMSSPPAPASQDGHTIRATSTSHAANATSTSTPQRHSITPVAATTRSTIPEPELPTPQKYIQQGDANATSTTTINNPPIRTPSATPYTSPFTAPRRPKEGPPIALLSRIAREKQQTASNDAPQPTTAADTANGDGEILVKPPSRRESLHATKLSDSTNAPPVSSISAQRSPSPVKARTTILSDNKKTLETPAEVQRQPAYLDPASYTATSGMAGVGAVGRSVSPPPSSGTPNTVLTTNGKLSASPQLLPVDHKYPNTIPEKIPLIRKTPSFTKEKENIPSSIPVNEGTPTPATIPVPASSSSSAATVRQSRIPSRAPEANGTPSSGPKPEAYSTHEQVSPGGPLSTKDRILALESKAGGSLRSPSNPVASPSRQSSTASAASSSVPSISNSRHVVPSPNGPVAPEPASPPLPPTPARAAEPTEVSKVVLTKGGTKINGVNYKRTRETSPTDHRRSHQHTNGAATATAAAPTTTTHEQGDVHEEPRKSRSSHRRSEKSSRSSHEQHENVPQQAQQHTSPQERPPVPAAQAPQAPQTSNHANGRSSTDRRDERRAARARSPPTQPSTRSPRQSHETQRTTRTEARSEEEQEEEEERFYPIESHLGNPELLKVLLLFVEFPDILSLSSISKVIRNMLEDRRELREEILERFLNTVGYVRWDFGKKREPLVLTLRDLNSYLRGVSIPIHRYAEIAEGQKFAAKDGKSRIVRLLGSSTRAYSKVVLRLRAQAEMELSTASPTPPQAIPDRSRPSSPLIRAQSPPAGGGTWRRTFHSPLYRIGHAPLLRVFVPSPDGPWLSDSSVLACEKELKRAGVVQLLKVGDVVWDSAVSDEAGFGNAGKLVWDGNYLIDLDYTFSTTGDIPPYLHSLSFPPAYFHRVLRSTGNPIMQLDLRPWGREVASNLQLIQDRGSAETPQGGRHAVMRWLHRSSFVVTKGIPIPDTTFSVDAGWEGRVVIEVEGTNEGLADLQLRCGPEWFKPQPGVQPKQGDGGRAFRLVRERSRPGEIWLRAVRMKERVT
ncbi:hypothetical protein FRC16_000437 [Serendipita sp. 398]|nr:hypothetical protein FRC16_000437 [Serendipita sp. 398]